MRPRLDVGSLSAAARTSRGLVAACLLEAPAHSVPILSFHDRCGASECPRRSTPFGCPVFSIAIRFRYAEGSRKESRRNAGRSIRVVGVTCRLCRVGSVAPATDLVGSESDRLREERVMAFSKAGTMAPHDNDRRTGGWFHRHRAPRRAQSGRRSPAEACAARGSRPDLRLPPP